MKLSFEQIGYSKMGGCNSSKWASGVFVVDPNASKILHRESMDKDELAISIAIVQFKDRAGESFLVVGTTTGMTFHPRKYESCGLKVYRFMPDGTINLLHTTKISNIPFALSGTPDGRLMVGVGKSLQIFELSNKHLLLKFEQRNAVPTNAVSIKPFGGRLYVSDAHESVHIYKYRAGHGDGMLSILADDVTPRLMTAMEVLDNDTIAGADKFGNIFILRLPNELQDAVESTKTHRLWDQSALDGAPNKVEQIAQFFVGETITSLQKTELVPGRPEVLVYGTIMGSIGVLVPFLSSDDADFFHHLEMHLRSTITDMVGRDHLSFRSAFIPVRHIVDGDLCAEFAKLKASEQQVISEELERSPAETAKKIEQLYMQLI